MNPSCGLSTLITKVIFLSALDISCAASVVVFALDSPERERREGSTTPCGVKDVVGPGSRPQSRLAAEKTECPLQRTTTPTEHARRTFTHSHTYVLTRIRQQQRTTMQMIIFFQQLQYYRS